VPQVVLNRIHFDGDIVALGGIPPQVGRGKAIAFDRRDRAAPCCRRRHAEQPDAGVEIEHWRFADLRQHVIDQRAHEEAVALEKRSGVALEPRAANRIRDRRRSPELLGATAIGRGARRTGQSLHVTDRRQT
jgi:hypothetical protein